MAMDPRICSICSSRLYPSEDGRSIARLKCGHAFHLDCIGSLFNAMGRMICPNCGDVELGDWRYAEEPISAPGDSSDETETEEANEHSAEEPISAPDDSGDETETEEANEPQFECQWCPFRGSADQYMNHVARELMTMSDIYYAPPPIPSSSPDDADPLANQDQDQAAGSVAQTSEGAATDSQAVRPPRLYPCPPRVHILRNLQASETPIADTLEAVVRQVYGSDALPRHSNSSAAQAGSNAAAPLDQAVAAAASSDPSSSQYRGRTDPSNAAGLPYMGGQVGFQPWNGSQTTRHRNHLPPSPSNPQENGGSHDHNNGDDDDHQQDNGTPSLPPRCGPIYRKRRNRSEYF